MNIRLKALITAAAAAIMALSQAVPAAADTGYIGIHTAEDLAAITGNGKYCIYNDIDLEGFDWKGISDFSGTLTAYSPCVIKNMSSDDCGLFRKLSAGAEITNIHIENADIHTDTKMLGGIAAYIPASSEGVEIKNCSVTGTVHTSYQGSSTKNYCGGIAGVVAAKDCVISGCSSSASVEGVLGEGGIVGLNYGSITDCAFTGRVMNALNVPPLDPNEEKVEVYNISFVTGGISGVNYGDIEHCAVLPGYCGSAEYLGLISGVNIKGKGNIEDCLTLGPDSSDDGDTEHYSDTANTVSSKVFSKELRS